MKIFVALAVLIAGGLPAAAVEYNGTMPCEDPGASVWHEEKALEWGEAQIGKSMYINVPFHRTSVRVKVRGAARSAAVQSRPSRNTSSAVRYCTLPSFCQ